jgi:hypothetical protein
MQEGLLIMMSRSFQVETKNKVKKKKRLALAFFTIVHHPARSPTFIFYCVFNPFFFYFRAGTKEGRGTSLIRLT